MGAYCHQVVLVRMEAKSKLEIRLRQLRLLLGGPSLERELSTSPAMQAALDGLLRATAFDAVLVEQPFIAHYRVRQAPAGRAMPLVVLDAHNIEHELVRRAGAVTGGPLRRLHYAVDWRKLRREEVEAFAGADAVAFTSREDEQQALALCSSLRSTVVPNGVDVEYFRRLPEHPPPDGRTIVFFGTLAYFPNQDGMLHFLGETWPRLQQLRPDVRLRIIGPRPTTEVLRHRRPNVEVTGRVDDLRPHLARAAAIIVPLRVGGGTRLKIVEAMAMARPIVSTTVGAEGIDAVPERDLLIGDTPDAFAAQVRRLLDSPELGTRIGASARALAEREYSWASVGDRLEAFLLRLRGALAGTASAAGGS
jgi:polysaccharide biosynthesis protein PslH